eukprot:CAMPEP_0205868666 /NCGR_PEP_ID=MMETSP1083-20121108/9606_1 /ASSEMBLY_ACC=CAM_ASM_000430 /TAXON_ID=97485 /ORGANISM="Prymnesium parvum, Strain Texoma1" /LENGTH=115 /DNA_ID=CAMNT_0053230815 /DNA_START=310 /DNA_END=657 /DNA_ORIENTATION=+
MAQQLAQIQVDAQLGTATRYSNSALQLDTATRHCNSIDTVQQLGNASQLQNGGTARYSNSAAIEMLMVDVRVAGHRTHQGAQPHKETTDLWHTSGTTTLAATAKSDGSLHDYYRA